MRKVPGALLLMGIVAKAEAQDRSPFELKYTGSFMHYSDTAAKLRQYDLRATTPLLKHTRQLLLGSVNARIIDPSGLPEAYSNTLYGLSAQLVWQYHIATGRTLQLFAQGGLFSDLKDISSEDIRYGAGIRYRLRHSSKLSTGWGLAYARQFFGNQVIPFIDLDYRPSSRWRISGQFPVKPEISYRLTAHNSLSFLISGNGNSYRLSSSGQNSRFVQITQWTAMLRFSQQLYHHWHLDIAAGRYLNQRLRLYEDGAPTSWTLITIPIRKKATPVQDLHTTGFMIQAGLSFRLPEPREDAASEAP